MNFQYDYVSNNRMVKTQISRHTDNFFIGLKNAFVKVFKKKDASNNKKAKTGGGGFREFVAKISRGLMLPIAILPIAGILLGVGAAIETNTTGVGRTIGAFIKLPGDVVFGNLPILFCIAVAIAFTKDSGPAALAAFVGWIVFNGTQSALINVIKDAKGEEIGFTTLWYTVDVMKSIDKSLFTNGLPISIKGNNVGITSLNTSVFGSILVAFIVAYLFNRYKNIQLPNIIGFFNGVRFVPIVVFGAMIPLAIAFLMIWPLIGLGLNYFGFYLGNAPVGINSLVFGYVERSLVPFGLHHAFYSPLWFTSAGGQIDSSGHAQIVKDGVLYNIVGLVKDGQITNFGQTTVGSFNNIHTWSSLERAISPEGDVLSGTINGDTNIWQAINANWAGQQVALKAALNGSAINSHTAVNGNSVALTNGYIAHTIQFGDFGNSIYPQSALSGYYFTHSASLRALGYIPGVSGVSASQYQQGKYSFMLFGLTAAAFAMIMAAPKENRKPAASVILSAAGTSFLTGITEPLEFTFLFLSPLLFWGFHAFMAALSFWFANLAQMHVGMTFSGGIIDMIVYGVVPVQSGTQFWWAFVIGAAYFPIYYFVFYFWIIKKNLQTPGRGENVRLFTKADYLNKDKDTKNDNENTKNALTNLSPQHIHAYKIMLAYGGVSNIKNVDACASKLRVQVGDKTLVNRDKLTKELGAYGVINPSPTSVYSIYGSMAEIYKSKIIDLLKNKEMLEQASKAVK